jgi:hypothetical protein
MTLPGGKKRSRLLRMQAFSIHRKFPIELQMNMQMAERVFRRLGKHSICYKIKWSAVFIV